MAIEQELHLLLEYARVPVEGTADANKPSSSRKRGESNQDEDAELTDLPSGRVPAREIFARLQRVRYQRVLPSTSIAADANLPELLVLVAEAAVFQQDFEVARLCVEWFLSDCDMKNQFYCRIQLVRAHCASNDAVHDVGPIKLRKVLNAIHYILLVLPVATDPRKRPQYDFLVYNASVTYWQSARQLMKKTTFQYLLPSVSAIVDALKTVGEKDIVWQIRLKLCLVYGQIDAKQWVTCAKTICDIVDAQLTPLLSDATLASDASFKAIYEEALRLQVHIGSFKDPECQKILGNLKKGGSSKRTSLVTKLQALKSGAFAGTFEAAFTEIFQETTGMSTFAASTTTDEEVAAHLRGLTADVLQTVDAEIIVDAGILAGFRQEYRLAACCDVVLQIKGKNIDPKYRVLHQVLKAILLAMVPTTSQENYKLTRSQRAALVVSRRCDGVRAIERALLACKRQQDPNLMENVCLYAWNLSLPLLQPSSRGQLSRLFSQAATALEELQSLQLNLRVRLLLEVAKLELQSEFVAKAQDATNKAIALDYATMTSSATTSPTLDELTTNQAKWLRRPLDVHLIPLKKRLDRKLAFEDPSTAEEELASAVEQLREAKDDTQRRRQVDRVLSIVDELRKKRESEGTGLLPPPPLELLLHLNTTSALVWHDLKDMKIARELVQETLQLFFPVGAEPPSNESENVFCNKSVMLLEVDLRLRLVEMIGSELKERAQRFEAALVDQSTLKNGKKKSQSSSMASRNQARKLKAEDEMDAAAVLLLSKESFALGLTGAAATVPVTGQDESVQQRRAAMDADLQQLKKNLLQELTAAMQVSTRIGWAFVIENTAVYLWNYHFHVFRLLLVDGVHPAASSILPECISAFESTLSTLEAMPPAVLNLDLLASVALGLALTQEKLGKLDKASGIADGILKRMKASATALPPAKATTATSISVLFLNRFAELKIRIQIQQNAKEIQPVDATPQLKVISFLEAMQVTLNQITSSGSMPPAQQTQLMDKASGFFQKAMAAWQPIASESIDQMKSDALSLEDQRQRLELYCEIWVRLGCRAFRFQNAKQAIECAKRVLGPIKNGLSDKEQRVWVVEATWKWLAIAELLFGRSILTLLSGETAAWRLIEAALTHLVSSIRFAQRAGASSVVLKASEAAWNTVLTAMSAVESECALGENGDGDSKTQWWMRLLPLLREVLTALDAVSGASRLRGDFGLLLLDVCEKSKQWKTAVEIAETLMKASSCDLPADQLKDVATFHAIATATMGGSSSSSGSGSGNSASNSGGKAKDQDPLMKAKIMRQIAFSSWRHPPSQLKALATAHQELDGKPEEQAVVLIEIAEWFYTHQFPVLEMDAHLELALSCLVREQQQLTLKHEKNDRPPSRGAHAGADTGQTHTPLWFAEKLLRVFTVRAVAAPSIPERWQFVQNAMQQVFVAWQAILDAANESDLRERFAAEVVADVAIEFDAWKEGKPTKYQPTCPRTVVEWVTCYQQYATSVASRFFSQWLNPLTKQADSAGDDGSPQSISNPILMCSVLERLLRLLSSYRGMELALPVMCLYQVVYHAFCPHKNRAVEIWMELTLYDVLEQLNLVSWNVPLQSALELLQSGGDVILKELQQQEQEDQTRGENGTHQRHRAVIKLSQVNVSEKVTQTVELLLQLGYVRQAKVLLAMLQSMADRKTSSREAVNQCIALTAQVYELEGGHDKARASLNDLLISSPSSLELGAYVKHILLYSTLIIDPHKAIEVLVAAERVAATAIMAGSECVLLNQPMHTQAISKYIASLSATATKQPMNALGMDVDQDAIVLLAQLKSQHARLLLGSSTTVASVEHALRVFKEASDLLALIEAIATRAELTVAFASRLIDVATNSDGHRHNVSDRQRDVWLMEARLQLREALSWLEMVRAQTFEPIMSTGEIAAVTIPLDLQIADVKTQLASVELLLEESATIVTELQMTWYAYERDTKRNIVEKWLDQTAERTPVERPGSTALAFVLASSVTTMLTHGPEHRPTRGLAHVLRLQSQRLSLYHHENTESRTAVQRLLWTRFVSENMPHATWVCAVNEGVSASEESRSTPSPSPSPEATENNALAEPPDHELIQRLESLAASLQTELKQAIEKRHSGVIRICVYELAQVYGCTQPSLCANALLHYQSVVVLEQNIKPLVDKCLATSNVTKLHMKRVNRLADHHTNAHRNSLPFQLSQLYLDQQSDLYKRMSVFVRVETILAALPAHTRVLSLQLSPDRCFLYAVMPGNNNKGVAVARMECTKGKLELLSALKTRIHAWRLRISQALLRGDNSVPATTTGQLPPSDLSDFTSSSGESPSAVDVSDELETEFNAIVAGMVEFFSPLFDHAALLAALQAELPGNSLVLIVDRELELLPLEALPSLDKADAISREFSIHLLYHRLAAVKAQPFRKEDVRVIVDPRHEDVGLNDQTLTSVVHQFTKKQGAVFTSWKDATDHGQVPTQTDWQQAMLLRRGGTLWYTGPNRSIGSAITLRTLAGMNLASSCYALVLLDRAENANSARRQSKVDSEKPRWELELEEDPYACALLSSLCGINVVVLNQWTATFNATRRLANGLLSGLAKGQSIAKALRKYPEGSSPISVAVPGQPSRKASVGPAGASATTSSAEKPRLKNRIRYNTAVFGLGYLGFKANE